MPGTRTQGYRSHSIDRRPKPRPTSDLKKLEQKLYRRDCLIERMRTLGKFTKEKHAGEAARLGYEIRVDISGYPIGLRSV